MPPPKTYRYTTNDVVITNGNKRIFLDFRDSSGQFVPSFREGDVCYRSYAMKKFSDAKSRCHPENRGYKGSEFHFLGFQDFTEWIVTQKFYGADDYQLDKDLFYDGGVLRYSPETCCLIPRVLNSNLMEPHTDTLLGATFEQSRNKFTCKIKITLLGSSKQFFFGRFDTAQECHETYIREKTKLIRNEIAESVKDLVDVRVYDRLKQWVPKIYRKLPV
jgi:hypothetical protein